MFNYKWQLKDNYNVPGIQKHGLKVFSCFACGGGSTMGYKLAGYDVIGFNEIDKKVAACYIENHNPKYQYVEPIQDFKNRTDLPEELLAEYPAEIRDEARLMVIHRDTGKIEHKIFKDIVNYFNDGDTFVMNNTKVFPARLFGNKEKTGAEIEVFLLRELNNEMRLWDVLVDPARKIRVGNKLYFGDG